MWRVFQNWVTYEVLVSLMWYMIILEILCTYYAFSIFQFSAHLPDFMLFIDCIMLALLDKWAFTLECWQLFFSFWLIPIAWVLSGHLTVTLLHYCNCWVSCTVSSTYITDYSSLNIFNYIYIYILNSLFDSSWHHCKAVVELDCFAIIWQSCVVNNNYKIKLLFILSTHICIKRATSTYTSHQVTCYASIMLDAFTCQLCQNYSGIINAGLMWYCDISCKRKNTKKSYILQVA